MAQTSYPWEEWLIPHTHTIDLGANSACPGVNMAWRLAAGRTKEEVIRCLKRNIIRDICHALRAGLATLETRL